MKWHMRFRGYAKLDGELLPMYHVHTDISIGFIVLNSTPTNQLYVGIVPEVEDWFIVTQNFIPFAIVSYDHSTDVVSDIGLMLEDIKPVGYPGVYSGKNYEIFVETDRTMSGCYTTIRVQNNNNAVQKLTAEVNRFNDKESYIYAEEKCSNYSDVECYEHDKYPLTSAFDFIINQDGTTDLF